mmetsp:Transcript_30143/g.56547  ORF Transcript_30143/g.56547 Transcript_30143/m.56547 type:complete len:300 (-) Transcript_30143:916-1815(-)
MSFRLRLHSPRSPKQARGSSLLSRNRLQGCHCVVTVAGVRVPSIRGCSSRFQQGSTNTKKEPSGQVPKYDINAVDSSTLESAMNNPQRGGNEQGSQEGGLSSVPSASDRSTRHEVVVPTDAMKLTSLEDRQPSMLGSRGNSTHMRASPSSLCQIPAQAATAPATSSSVSAHTVEDATSTNNADRNTAENNNKSILAMERENFLLFVKILFKILDQANEQHTATRAKRIVLECRRRSQQGDPNFHPLMGALESRLRRFVGESTWRKAHLFLHHYMSTKRPSGGMVMPETNNIALAVGNQR